MQTKSDRSGVRYGGDIMTTDATTTPSSCIFCAIIAGQSEASFVYEDDTVVAFMSLHPVTTGHLLVVPRTHTARLDDVEPTVCARVWSVGNDMARALRRSTLRCDGINLFVCDGEAAFQTVPHFHLHVIPRHADDEWQVNPEDGAPRERTLLDAEARAIKDASHPLRAPRRSGIMAP